MIVPTTHRILVKPDLVEEIDAVVKSAKAAGIHMVDFDSKKREQAGVDSGRVVAFGPTAFQDFNTENPLKPNDYIAYARFAGKYIKDPFTQEEFVLLNDEDVVCIFKE